MPDRSLVFIHGFGSTVKVWAKLIQRIHDDPDLSEVRVFPFGYPSRVMPRAAFADSGSRYDDIAQLWNPSRCEARPAVWPS